MSVHWFFFIVRIDENDDFVRRLSWSRFFCVAQGVVPRGVGEQHWWIGEELLWWWWLLLVLLDGALGCLLFLGQECLLVAPLEPFAVSSQNHHVPPQVEYFAVLVDSLLDLVDVNNAGTWKKESGFAVEHVEKPQPAGPEESVVVDLDVWVFLEHWFGVVESVRGTRSYRLHSRVIDDSNPQKGVTSVDVTRNRGVWPQGGPMKRNIHRSDPLCGFGGRPITLEWRV